MLIVWWMLWLYPALVVAPTLTTCSRKWVRMTDTNYERAIKHYADCALLGQALDPPARELYQSNIVVNLQRSCDFFFKRTSLPTSGLIGIVREVAKILEGFEPEAEIPSEIINNSLSWSTMKDQCESKPTPNDDGCPNFESTRSPEKCEDTSQNTSSSASYSKSVMYFVLVLLLLLLSLQIIFLIWFCCCNNCICLEMCKNKGFCLCNSEDSYPSDLPAQEVYHMTDVQHDLASLSSENIGSDSEFEALLKMTKLPKTKRQWHSKEAD